MNEHDSEKLRRFEDEVIADANARAAEIRKRVEEARARIMAEGKKAADADAAEWFENEAKVMRRENAREYSRASSALRGGLLLEREKLIKSITEKTAQRLRAFADSEDYLGWLVSLVLYIADSCRGMGPSGGDPSFTIYLSQRDAARYKYDVLRALENRLERLSQESVAGYSEAGSPVYTVVPDSEITLGGARLVAGNLAVNETLDENLRLTAVKMAGQFEKA